VLSALARAYLIVNVGQNSMPLIAETSMQVLGKDVVNPTLQLVGFLSFILIFAGMASLAMTVRMVDEERIRAEPSISKLFGAGLPPRRILTDTGRKLQIVGFACAGLGLALTLLVFALQ
jgi:hypothetical protein